MFSFIFYKNFCDPSEFSHLFFSKDFPECPKLFLFIFFQSFSEASEIVLIYFLHRIF